MERDSTASSDACRGSTGDTTAPRGLEPHAEPYVRGNGDCHHHGSPSRSISVIHLTHQNPRRPGATRRAGAPCPAESGTSPTCVATSSPSASERGNRRQYPVADRTTTEPPSTPSSSRSRRAPRHTSSAYQPPVQSRVACRTSPNAASSSTEYVDAPPATRSRHDAASSSCT